MLLDPVWSQRASPFRFVGPKRVNDPGIAFADLPPIDVVLMSQMSRSLPKSDVCVRSVLPPITDSCRTSRQVGSGPAGDIRPDVIPPRAFDPHRRQTSS